MHVNEVPITCKTSIRNWTSSSCLHGPWTALAIRMNPNQQFKNMLGELQKGMALVMAYW